MRTSATGRPAKPNNRVSKRSSAAGFTLLELLLVLLIIGLGVGVASISLRGEDGIDTLRQVARQLVIEAELVSEEAVLTGAQWGLRWYSVQDAGETRYGYQWLRLGDSGWRQQAPVERNAQVSLPASVVVTLQVEEEDVSLTRAREEPKRLAPDVWFQSNGEATPFALELSSGGARLTLQGDLLARFSVDG